MITNRYLGIGKLHLGLQIFLSVSLFGIVFYLLNQFNNQGEVTTPNLYVAGSAIWAACLLVEYLTRRTKDKRLAGLTKDMLKNITYRQLVFAMLAIFGFILISKDNNVSRLFLVTFLAMQSAWLWWSNLYGYRLLHRFLYKRIGTGLSPTLVVGNHPEIEEFINNSKMPSFPGLDFKGYISPDSTSSELAISEDLPTMGRFQDMRNICQNSDIKAVLLLGMQGQPELVKPVVSIVDDLGLRAMWVDNVHKQFGKNFHPYHTDDFSIVSHINEPLENPVNRFWKRIFDIVASSFGIIFTLPPTILLVWILQLLNSRGPLFYLQERTGRNGSKFKIIKFRSMYVDGKDNSPTTKNDSRIFPGGDFIRKSSIDELPQLINVFLGDMSIVGPRPHADFTDEEHADFTHQYRLRSLVKPGITGLAQSKGFRGETIDNRQIKNRIRLDLFYIQKWRLSLDILIILLTLLQVIKPPNSAM